MEEKILVIGANGQVGSALVKALRARYGELNVIATDIHGPKIPAGEGPFIPLDILNKVLLQAVVREKKVTQIYAMAALLSARAEQQPEHAWHLNMQGLLNVLELARKYGLKVFWPSSIAVFGPSYPWKGCPQNAIAEPTTVYGISKVAGELWCRYYHDQFGVDVRSVRYPGLISYETAPGGGTTDYAVAIFQEALVKARYTCFLAENTRLPMMYMPDAIRATVEIMEAPPEKVKIRTSYNVAAISFTPKELAAEIRKYVPLEMDYSPDYRQQIAESWPQIMEDTAARIDWAWQQEYDLEKMTREMLLNLKAHLLAHEVIH